MTNCDKLLDALSTARNKSYVTGVAHYTQEDGRGVTLFRSPPDGVFKAEFDDLLEADTFHAIMMKIFTEGLTDDPKSEWHYDPSYLDGDPKNLQDVLQSATQFEIYMNINTINFNQFPPGRRWVSYWYFPDSKDVDALRIILKNLRSKT